MNRSWLLSSSSVLTVVIVISISSCTRFSGNGYRSAWERYPDSRWAGPDLWANRLADWEVKAGRLTCTGTLPMRTVHLVTRRITPEEGDFITLVHIERDNPERAQSSPAAGILCGAGASLDHRSASLIFHSYGEGAGYFIGIDCTGKVFIRDFTKENYYPEYARTGFAEWREAILKITAQTAEPGVTTLDILAVDPVTRTVISELRRVKLPTEKLAGNIALVSHSGYGSENRETFSFEHWVVRGSRIESAKENNIGPIVTAQYTVSLGTMKMTSQLMPLTRTLCDSVELQFVDEDKWQTIAVSPVDTPSFTASFKIEKWTGSEDRKYRLVARYRYGKEKVNSLAGIIRHDPVEKESIKLVAVACNEQVIKPDPKKWSGIDAGYFPYDSGILFPFRQMTGNIERQEPDMLFFAGDQVYEGASPTAAESGKDAIYDYLYKWYLWCISFRELTTNIPCITIPDDHDVYHGNLWGCGGKATPSGLTGKEEQDAGGYRMPARFVNMVQKTQTSHLPDPVDPLPAEHGIGVYFTEYNLGGISFAIIEDRKFKSAPRDMLPDAMIENGWSQNPSWNPKRLADVPGATLLGERQNTFLEKWAGDWSGDAWMKVVLSQTLWSTLATLPDSAASDDVVPYMPVPDSGVYVTGDKVVADFDSDGWPQSGRNRALKTIRKAFALHIAGDQHLASTIRYGTDNWEDAGFAIVTPAAGNIFPRRWFPPVPGMNRKEGSPLYTGDFEDGFGNKMTVYAVANPHKSQVQPVRQNELATGYCSVVFNRRTREIEMYDWPGYANPLTDSPFPGWPVKISQTDNYGRKATAWLPEVVTEGMTNPVIKVISEATEETIYSLRISGNSFQPWVFAYGLYTIEAGNPDTDVWKRVENVAAWSTKERQKLTIAF